MGISCLLFFLLANEKLQVKVIVTPNVGFATLYVSAQGFIKDPKKEVHCPSYEFDWGDGCKSKAEEYCDPYEMPENQRVSYATDRKVHKYRSPGMYDLKFKVKDVFGSYEASGTVLVY